MDGSVLVVGDAPDLTGRLGRAGFDVMGIGSGAGDDFRTPNGRPPTDTPDCVLVVTWDEHGSGAAEWPCPVLAVVGDPDAGASAVAAGADDYVIRGDSEVLVRRVELAAAAGRWRRSAADSERREQVLARLHEATRELMRAETERAVAEVGVRAAADIVGLVRSTCFLLEDGVLEPVANTGAAEDLFGDPPSFEPGQGVTGTAFENGRIEVLADGQRDERADSRGSDQIRSFVAVPLGDYGVLTAASPRVDAYEGADVDGVQVLASNMEAAFERAARERTLAERERELERRNETLQSFTTLVSHDLRNPLNVARGHLELAAADCDHESIAAADEALERMESLVAEVLELARQGEAVGETEPVELAETAREAWATVDSGAAHLEVVADRTLDADPERLRTLFENLFQNAVEHGSTGSRPEADDSRESDALASKSDSHGESRDAVEHGSTGSQNAERSGDAVEHGSTSPQQTGDAVADDSTGPRRAEGAARSGTEAGERAGEPRNHDPATSVAVRSFDGGFVVADDGPGMREDVRDSAFDQGFTTAEHGTGFGLSTVRSIAEAHGWRVELAGDDCPVDFPAGAFDGARVVFHTDGRN